jgi:cyclopropane fatty-acyl-phospholipid synthase-like methyltransferase
MSGYYFKEHPKTCAPDDFWGQVKRTVNGKPVTQDQIDMIVAAVRDGLQLGGEDVVLDICCGNGALTTYFFQYSAGGLGVDFSDYLIEVARQNFVKRESEAFLLADVVEFARSHERPERFTKAVCYGSFQYLPKDAAAEFLRHLRARFTGLRAFFIGNIPDRERAASFHGKKVAHAKLDSPETPIGIWRSREEFTKLAADTGWRASYSLMPAAYYGAGYRYDVLLTSV